MNIKLIPNQWVTKNIPISVIKHRLLTTDPTYKFTINALVHGRSNIGIRRDSANNDYYDIANMSIVQNTPISPAQWLSYINLNWNLNLSLGSNYQSSKLPELFFDSEEMRNVFDYIYDNLQNSIGFSAEGINILVDFTVKLSGGFIRNKLALDTDKIKNWIIDGLSFSALKMIMIKDEIGNFKVKSHFKNLYDLSKEDIELLESVCDKNNNLYPKNNNNQNIFWYYLNEYMNMNTLEAKEILFGFRFKGAVISEVHTKDVSFALDKYNNPIYIQTQSKFDYENQKAYVTLSTQSVPVSIIYDSILKRNISIEPSKNIQTKINSHIYMVNKK